MLRCGLREKSTRAGSEKYEYYVTYRLENNALRWLLYLTRSKLHYGTRYDICIVSNQKHKQTPTLISQR